MKNQLFLTRFIQVYEKVIPIDTSGWKKRPWILLRLLMTIAFHKNAKVIISANPASADTLIRVLSYFHFPNDFFYWVVGGSFHRMIEEGRFKIKHYLSLKGIFVQGEIMVKSLNRIGINNVVYVPNSKLINHYGNAMKKNDGKTHFVFLSRVEEYKGCTDILLSVDALNKEGYQNNFEVTFFGHLSRDTKYASYFSNRVNEIPNVEYLGVLNLLDEKNYDVLSSFDVMLFPTYWEGEGFPGVVIDAYIASLPIIASDWNLNKDVVHDGITGWLIPSQDSAALTERMRYVINNHQIVRELAVNCRKQAEEFDSRIVLSENNLFQLGLL